jgi:class 3 adenylate cyclase
VAELALALREEVARHRDPDGQPLAVRIGIDTGPVVAGVIGTSKFSYDLWGDTVNTASRMESQGVVGCIQVTDRTYRRLRDRYRLERRGPIQVKGKGELVTWFLLGRRGA